MKLIRFFWRGKKHYGQLEGDCVYPFVRGFHTNRTGECIALSQVKLLCPVNPSKVIGVGLNYIDHAKELDFCIPKEPIIFIKPKESVIGEGEFIVKPTQCKRLDYEAELGVVIGKKGKNIAVAEVERYVLGYTCVNDVTARDLQKIDGQWTRAKGFDTFCPIGRVIETDVNTSALNLTTYINGEARQTGNTRDMIFPIPYLVSFISQVMTLNVGDVIATGTPKGIGEMLIGDSVTIEIEKIGSLHNTVRSYATL